MSAFPTSNSSLIGAFGLARQSSKDTAAPTLTYLPTTSIGLNINQNTQTIPPEIGGSYFLRGSYKASASGGGDVGTVIRPNAIGNHLYALCGQDTASAVSGQSGAYQHIFTPFAPASGVDLPWFTLLKDITRLGAEQYLNAKLRGLSISVPKANLATAQTSWLATTPSAVAVPSGGTEVMDTSPVFQTCVASFALTAEVGGATISAATNHTERVQLDFNNQISEDEFSVGNYYLDQITLLQRTVAVNMDFVVRDAALYQAVYYNNLSITSGQAWQPTVFRGSVTLTLTSNTNIGATTQPYSLQFTFPGLDFLMLPIQLSGAELVRASLSTQVTLGPSGTDQFTITLINGVSSY